MNRSYSELIKFPTFEERFTYLKLDGVVGEETFGFQRWANQELYHSKEWKIFKDQIIIRDNGCDLGMPGFEMKNRVYIHHINPITYDDIVNRHSCVFDPENVICVSFKTHNAIHYSDENALPAQPKERTKNDTCPWRKND